MSYDVPKWSEQYLMYTVSFPKYDYGKDELYWEVWSSVFQILYQLKLKPLTLDRI